MGTFQFLPNFLPPILWMRRFQQQHIKNNNKDEVCMLPEGGSTLKIFDGTLLSDLLSLVMRNLEFSATKTKKARGLS